jgi:hypothetical protein
MYGFHPWDDIVYSPRRYLLDLLCLSMIVVATHYTARDTSMLLS